MLSRFYTAPLVLSSSLATLYVFICLHVYDKKIVPLDTSSGLSHSAREATPEDNTITVVTAYFDIGAFQKGPNPKTMFRPELYFRWAAVFEFMVNPVVFYTDSRRFQEIVDRFRSKLKNKTKIILIDRNSSWAFQRVQEIRSIYKMPGYPKHYPNTVVPEYSCAQHVKYDVVARASKADYFQTRYYAWLDVGYFRNLLNTRNQTFFVLRKPPNFNDSRIAMNLVTNYSLNTQYAQIFKRNLVWVGGGLFLGRKDIIIEYEQIYRRAVDFFLSRTLMNTDQQMNFAIHSAQGKKDFESGIELQLYESKHKYDWFYLGYLMRKVGLNFILVATNTT